MKYLYITLLIFLTLQCNRPKIEEYEYEKYGKVTGDVTLRESYTKESERIKTITKGSIILLTAKIEKTLKTGEVVIWYKARSYSGEEGYVFGDFVTLISLDIAKKELLRKRNQFEIYLKNLIIIATSERIKSSNQFPYDILTDIQIITPLEETSSSSYNLLDERSSLTT
ncbi:SH3 domain-containing protein [Leptospira bandrabouensis]|uniref:SH3 domain-containing protein n=1 Tax=Leptospira bandrabouensis TaxID=2484903 RepID=UPI001EEA66B1|nr:SH3 domain-containing protein [Leptospira bandrabouensis]MCG6153138.1 SH3 domain-containing protein [Leptospira bandrabouensis]